MDKYKINKTINLGIIEDYNAINSKYGEYTIFGVIISLEKIENKNISKEQISEITNIFNILESNFGIIFSYEKFFKPKFESSFYYSERKKLAQIKISEEIVNDRIYRKYEEIYKNLQKNVFFLKKHSERPLEDLEKLTNILKTLRYLKYDLEKLLVFFTNFIYNLSNKEKNETLKKIKGEIDNIENFTKSFLSYYSKKSGKGEEIFKVALNPAILNTHTEVNREFITTDIQNLEKEVKELEEKNNQNRKTKEDFLGNIDSYMNYILYEKGFFDKTKNKVWYEYCKKSYEEISSIRKNLYDEKIKFINLPKSTQFTCDFLNKNPIKFADEIYFDNYIKSKLLKQELETKNSDIFLDEKNKIELGNYNFIQINTLKYQLLWEKIELKEKKEDFQKLSQYITILKGEINTRLKKGKYGEFVKIGGEKSKTAQSYSQKLTELVNKQNFDKELKDYSHFGYIIKGNNRVFLYLLEKDKNLGFTHKKAKEEIEKYKVDKSDFNAYIFLSLTLKGLTKLAFIKQAFGEVSHDLMNIYKQKSFAEKRNGKYNNNYKENLKQYIQFLLNCIKSDKGKELFDYIKLDNFKKVENYNTLSEFEKDLLKYAYKIDKTLIDIEKIDKEKIYELDIVNRKFEKEKQYKGEKPELKRQNDIHIFSDFLNSISSKNTYESLRLLPEIKLYLNTSIKEETEQEKNDRKLMNLENKKNYNGYEIFRSQRFFRNKLRASFLFEYNPIEINKNPEIEKEKYLKNIIKPNSLKEDFSIFGIDIGENEFATLGIYDKNLIPQDIIVNGKKEKIVDLTNLKVENGCIVKKDSKNSEKYKFFKEFYEQIIKYQIHLKDILTEIGDIEIKEGKEYGELSKKISGITEKYLGEDKFDNALMKKFFGNFTGLARLLFDFIKSNNGIFKNSNKNYHEIFKQLEMMKVINFKDAFSSNFVGVIKELLNKYPNSIIIFENLFDNKKYDFTHIITQEQLSKLSSKEANIMKSFGAYTGNYIFQSIFISLSKIYNNGEIKQYVYLDKNITNSLKSQDGLSGYNGNIFWIEAEGTSTTCPNCEMKIFRDKKGGDVLYHTKESPGKNGCNFDIRKGGNNYGFSFITSGDDLATYNIAKKGLEYLTLLTNTKK